MNSSISRSVTLKFKKLHLDAMLPRRWSDHAVGWDVHAYLKSDTGRNNSMVLPQRTTRLVPTGLLIEPPPGHFVMMCARSGLALKSITLGNGVGILDPDYRGELRVLLYNGSHETQWVRHEDRIAQIFVLPIVPMSVNAVEELSQSKRGGSGLGSTGGLSQ